MPKSNTLHQVAVLSLRCSSYLLTMYSTNHLHRHGIQNDGAAADKEESLHYTLQGPQNLHVLVSLSVVVAVVRLALKTSS
jgi:hypothetical protein